MKFTNIQIFCQTFLSLQKKAPKINDSKEIFSEQHKIVAPLFRHNNELTPQNIIFPYIYIFYYVMNNFHVMTTNLLFLGNIRRLTLDAPTPLKLINPFSFAMKFQCAKGQYTTH